MAENNASLMWKEIATKEIDNVFRLIGEDWMLITARDGAGKVNAMTASWGGMGVLWNKSVAFSFIRPQRYTFGLTEASERFSLCFPDETYRAALRYCGTHSGRDGDKLAAAGLTAAEIDGVPVIAESRLVLLCRKLYRDDIRPECFSDAALLSNYPENDYHRMYICEIERALLRA